MKELKLMLESVTRQTTKEEMDARFPIIARYIMDNYGIKSGDRLYLLNEIEFYYYNPLYDDLRAGSSKSLITYKRNAAAGCWFFHEGRTGADYRSYFGRSKKTALENNEEKGYTMVNGIINVYKEKGYTSFDVVAKLRGIFKQKKIGHTGTLDPDAEGVLPVCLGKATKVCDLLTDKSKEYETVLLLGKVTDTQDITGTVLEEKDVKVTEEAVRETVLSFVGDYMQIPPMYSALKVNGKKLCDLAREGKTVERQARPVKILTIDILDVTLPRVRMRVHCSKGTYIRTLLEDIAAAMGQKGTMSALRRTTAGVYTEADAHTLEEIQAAKDTGPEALQALMLPVESVFESLPLLVAEPRVEQHLYNGCPTSRYPAADGRYRVRNAEGQFLGLANITGGVLKVEKLFVERN